MFMIFLAIKGDAPKRCFKVWKSLHFSPTVMQRTFKECAFTPTTKAYPFFVVKGPLKKFPLIRVYTMESDRKKGTLRKIYHWNSGKMPRLIPPQGKNTPPLSQFCKHIGE